MGPELAPYKSENFSRSLMIEKKSSSFLAFTPGNVENKQKKTKRKTKTKKPLHLSDLYLKWKGGWGEIKEAGQWLSGQTMQIWLSYLPVWKSRYWTAEQWKEKSWCLEPYLEVGHSKGQEPFFDKNKIK